MNKTNTETDSHNLFRFEFDPLISNSLNSTIIATAMKNYTLLFTKFTKFKTLFKKREQKKPNWVLLLDFTFNFIQILFDHVNWYSRVHLRAISTCKRQKSDCEIGEKKVIYKKTKNLYSKCKQKFADQMEKVFIVVQSEYD